ncbi:MAG: hypothetical protein AABX17_01340 [Nanoarchaeota archaeon]
MTNTNKQERNEHTKPESALVGQVITAVVKNGVELTGKEKMYFDSIKNGRAIGIPAVLFTASATRLAEYLSGLGYKLS